MPKTLFWRTIVILAVPLIVVQLVVGIFFYDRLFRQTTLQKTNEVIQQIKFAAGDAAASRALGLGLRRLEAMPLMRANTYTLDDLTAPQVIEALTQGFPRVYFIDLARERGWVHFEFRVNGADYSARFLRNRASARNPHQLLVAMLLSSIIMAGIAGVFLKNQVRPISLLARVADSFAKGRIIEFKPRGADEIRKVGVAFQSMMHSIDNQKEQRILMLSGVSHDLRTPLTRMKLAVSLAESGADSGGGADDEISKDIKQDIADMEAIIQEFLDFARGDATESRAPVDAVKLARHLIAIHKRAGVVVELQGEYMSGDKGKSPSGSATINLRRHAIIRALSNLIDNAAKFAGVIHLGLDLRRNNVVFRIEDDGPGIPASDHEKALRPFERLDQARNQNKSTGTGLGLSIAADIIRNHGGTLDLGTSERLGGLLVEVTLPR